MADNRQFAIAALWKGEELLEHEGDKMKALTSWRRGERVQGAENARKRGEALETTQRRIADSLAAGRCTLTSSIHRVRLRNSEQPAG